MKLYLKQKLFSFKDKFFVYDEWGREKYSVEGEMFSFGKRLHVYDMFGNEVAFVKQRILSFSPRFKIYVGNNEVAEVLKRFTMFKPHYSVFGTNWEVQGDFFDHNYAVYDNNLPVASVRKEWMTWADAYSIDIAPYVDELTALCVVLVVDAAMDTGELIH